MTKHGWSQLVLAVLSSVTSACGGSPAPRHQGAVEAQGADAQLAKPIDCSPDVVCSDVIATSVAAGPTVAPTVQWRVMTGDRIVATAAEVSGDIVVGSLDGKVYRVSRDGTLIATTDTGAPIQASPAPMTSTRDALVGNAAGQLVRIKPDGTIAWTVALHGPVVTAPLLASSDSFYVAADGIYLVDRDGNILWHHVEATTIYEQPVQLDDGDIRFATVDGRIVTLDADGQVRANVVRPPVDEDAPPAMPKAVIDRVGNRYFVTRDQMLVATQGDGTPLWRYSLGANVAGSVLLTSTGTLVVGADDGILYALY